MEKQFYSPEIWGGIECTINRVKNQYFDQLEYAEHYSRPSDIEAIADIGIKKMRYPILWEKHQPQKNTAIDWSWISKHLDLIRGKGIDVIAGLVHHGSGPAFTNLLDKQFPFLLAAYARQVAEQFPWIQYYTPVNEPLTTARFSGMYGLWYPHKKNTKAFIQMLLNELKGTVLAMQEIRKVNPRAQLVQTEDLGKTYSTPKLKYQADYENERRWLTYDILCGDFTEKHVLWKHFLNVGIAKEELDFFITNPCPPDIFGFNHYLTSERYLDERLQLYPSHTHGGNGRHRYADVEAVRVELDEETGIEVLLQEAWDRYQKPLVITEVHLHCHREEQLRWFKHVWEAAKSLVAKGVDLRAITSWAMLGSFGWNKLLTQPKGEYEPGAFDLRSGLLRPTALASFIKNVFHQESLHPLSAEKGWWLRNNRILYGPHLEQVHTHQLQNNAPILIIGKNGTLGKALARVCEIRCIRYELLGRQDCNINLPQQINTVIEKHKPLAIINAAGYVRVDDAENDAEACFRDNTSGVQNLALACQQYGIRLITFSSDLVFDGKKQTPYVESDKVNPLNVYGQSKAQSEALLNQFPSMLVIRSSAFFSPWDHYNFAHFIKQSLLQAEPVKVANDFYISPTYVPDLVHATLDLLIDEESGIWHLANTGELSWADFALRLATAFDLESSLIQSVPSTELNYTARRPGYSVLGSERGYLLPSLDDALERFKNHEKVENRKVA